MRIGKALVAVTLMTYSTLAATARADEPTLPTAPAGAPLALSTTRPTPRRPTSVEDYDARLSALRDAVRDSAGDERAANQAELDELERWYDEDVHRHGPVLGAGITLLVASPLLGLGAVGMAGGGLFDGAKALGISALASVVVGIPLTIVGAQRSVRSPNLQVRPPPVSLGFTVGPASLGLQGSF
jgi:hypothetical protein